MGSSTSSAGNRINSLLDEKSFVEIGSAVTARATDFNLDPAATPSDGVITGYGTIDGNRVYVYSQDASVLGGSIGAIAGMQVFTKHHPLDFRPSAINEKGEVVEENQFLNIGVGVHVKTIMAILDSKGVKYEVEGNDQGFRIVG